MRKLLGLFLAATLCWPAASQTLFNSSGGTPGGSTTQLQYNNAGAFGGVSGWTTNGTTALTGGASTTVAIGGATIGSNALAVTGTGLFNSSVITSGVTGRNVSIGYFGANQIDLPTSGFIVWNSAVTLINEAANTLAQRNGVNAQKSCVYNTFTDASNYERGCLDWITSANILSIGTQSAGTGTLRNISLIGGTVSVANTTDSTTTTSGALQVAGGFAVRKRVFIDGISASAGLQTAVLCQSSGGEMIADSVACLASASRFKDVHGPMPNGALAKLIKLPIDRWSYKEEGNFTSTDWTRERIGPLADDVAAMDSRLAGYDSDGNVRTYSTEQLLGYTIKALQELKADNDNLRDEVRRFAR